MWKTIMAGLLLAAALLAAPPIPSKVITVKLNYLDVTASIVVGTAAPSDSQLFSDEQEVLASIDTANDYGSALCELGMHSILTRPE